MKCIFPNCEKESISRGLCKSHYTIAVRLIMMKQTTWKELENKKKCLPLKTKQKSWFLE